jgi:hypothetical protein
LKINFLYILNRFDVLILKIIFLKKTKHYFDAFQHEKHFKKQSQPHSQTIPPPLVFIRSVAPLRAFKKIYMKEMLRRKN